MPLHYAEWHYNLTWRWLWEYWYKSLVEFMPPAMREACLPPEQTANPTPEEQGLVFDGVYIGP